MTLKNDVVNFQNETQANPYLMGGYAPVDTEITADQLEVIGKIPDDLHGIYVRNGPNPKYEPVGRYHWFDGDGMLHAVHFENGKATYRNRWIRTEGFEREAHEGKLLFTGIMEPPMKNPKVKGLHLPLKDTANTSIHYHNNKLIALWYLAGQPYALDPVTLETLGVEDFGGALGGSVSAHAKVDERTGEMMFFDYSPVPPYMCYGVVDANGQLKHYAPIDLPGPRLPHDMAITERYSILMDLPLINDPEALKAGRHKIVFKREMPSRFAVLPRYGDNRTARWLEAKPCFMYHTVNAWEEGDDVIMDCCRVQRPAPPEGAVTSLDKMLGYLRLDAKFYRYRFNMVTGQTHEEALDDANTEFPTMNTWQLGCKTRYAYNVHITSDFTLFFDGLFKYDTQTGGVQRHWFGKGKYGSEAPFASRPNPQDEDDGYIVSFVWDEAENQSEVWVLDAKEIEREPLARVKLPQRVPLGFHACWVPGDRLLGSGK